MDLFSEIRTAVQYDQAIGSESAFYTQPIIDLAINRSYRKAAGLFRWPETMDAKKTNTIASQDYYDYPDTWRSNSIWKLVVDSQDYGRPMRFEDFLYERENDDPSGIVYKWANYGRRFYIDPTPTTNGVGNNLEIWGQRIVDALANDGDTTIFSYVAPECNDAIALEAVAILKNRGRDSNSSQFFSNEAKAILGVAWQKIRQEVTMLQNTQGEFFIEDMFAVGTGSKGQKTGNF